jgi:hypothetical protein
MLFKKQKPCPFVVAMSISLHKEVIYFYSRGAC